MREKEIEDAVRAVTEANKSLGRTAFSLDIYGPVDENQTEWFEKLQKTFPDFVRYGGRSRDGKRPEIQHGACK